MPFREGLTPEQKAQFISKADQALAEDRDGMEEMLTLLNTLIQHENGDRVLAHAAMTRTVMEHGETDDPNEYRQVVFRLSSLLATATLMLVDRDEAAQKP